MGVGRVRRVGRVQQRRLWRVLVHGISSRGRRQGNHGSPLSAGFLYNGALSTYEKLGFVHERKIGKHRWVVTRVVESSS
jgi:hypothetical protein